jgi:hypothetical protein
MKLGDVQRFSRHVALPEFGPDGQQRVLDAVVAIDVRSDRGMALETAVLYLGNSGVRQFRVLLAEGAVAPLWLPRMQSALPVAQFVTTIVGTSRSSWDAAFDGCHVVVRGTLPDDVFAEACHRKSVAVVMIQSDGETIDVLSLRPSTPSALSLVPELQRLPSPLLRELTPTEEASSVVAGTLAAAEALWLVAGRGPRADDCPENADGVIRHLRVPISSPTERPATHNIPWPSV